jgi:monoamine oxidase
MSSVASLFGRANAGKLIGYNIHNWLADPYCRGGYTYSTPGSNRAMMDLRKPVSNTIYFAGEGFNTDEQTGTGTVEAALVSAEQAVREMLSFAKDDR